MVHRNSRVGSGPSRQSQVAEMGQWDWTGADRAVAAIRHLDVLIHRPCGSAVRPGHRRRTAVSAALPELTVPTEQPAGTAPSLSDMNIHRYLVFFPSSFFLYWSESGISRLWLRVPALYPRAPPLYKRTWIFINVKVAFLSFMELYWVYWVCWNSFSQGYIFLLGNCVYRHRVSWL